MRSFDKMFPRDLLRRANAAILCNLQAELIYKMTGISRRNQSLKALNSVLVKLSKKEIKLNE